MYGTASFIGVIGAPPTTAEDADEAEELVTPPITEGLINFLNAARSDAVPIGKTT